MKNFTLILVVFFLTFTVDAQQIIQQEGFAGTSIPTGWMSDNLTSGCTWQYGYIGDMPDSGSTTPADFPTGAALFDDSTCGTYSQDHIILTAPELDLSQVSNAEIEVIYNLQVFADKGEFIIEVFDGTIWQQVFFQDVDSPRDTGTHQTANIDVSTFLNSAFKVRFIYDDEGYMAKGLGIDDYKLSGTSTAGIEDLSMLGFNYYPNPTTDLMILTAAENIEKVNIYNIIGQKVLFEDTSDINVELDLQELPMGTYIVQVQVADKFGSFKMLKQ
ncbi:MAG: T9SS type A sorting domain-containing protein [Bacteroidota bacterium]